MRGRRPQFHEITARDAAWVRSVSAGQGRARSTLVQLQCEMRRPNPSPRHADRHDAVGPGAEHKAAVVAYLLHRFDPSWGTDAPIYSPEGEWSYERFENWLARTGVRAWPRLASGQLDIDGDAFRLMYHVPGIEGLHALRDSLGVIVRSRIPIGPDGRNRPSLFPFCTASGRNAQAKSLFNAHAGVRSFMVFPPNKIGVYLDWRTQEVGIAAALSGDEALKAAYRAGDVYHSLAVLCGLTNLDAKTWKAEHQTMRQRMKSLQLGINYGMTVRSLARGIDRHPLIASAIAEKHRREHLRFWEWRDQQVTHAMLTRKIETVFGWPLHISTSPNKRTLYNFPMQANGAEMLRIAAQRLCDANLVPSMLVHDGILLEVDNEEQIAHAIEIMRGAGRDVCNGFEIGVDIDQKLVGGVRYRDKRPVAQQMWATIMDALEAVGALPRGPRHELRHPTWPTDRGRNTRHRHQAATKDNQLDLRQATVGVGSEGHQGYRHAESASLDLLQHRAWKTKSRTFPLSNDVLRGCGISRYVKRHTLQQLEAAGLITLKQLPGRAPIVTLLEL